MPLKSFDITSNFKHPFLEIRQTFIQTIFGIFFDIYVDKQLLKLLVIIINDKQKK